MPHITLRLDFVSRKGGRAFAARWNEQLRSPRLRVEFGVVSIRLPHDDPDVVTLQHLFVRDKSEFEITMDQTVTVQYTDAEKQRAPMLLLHLPTEPEITVSSYEVGELCSECGRKRPPRRVAPCAWTGRGTTRTLFADENGEKIISRCAYEAMSRLADVNIDHEAIAGTLDYVVLQVSERLSPHYTNVGMCGTCHRRVLGDPIESALAVYSASAPAVPDVALTLDYPHSLCVSQRLFGEVNSHIGLSMDAAVPVALTPQK